MNHSTRSPPRHRFHQCYPTPTLQNYLFLNQLLALTLRVSFLTYMEALSEFILFLISSWDNVVFTWYVIPSRICEPNLTHFSTCKLLMIIIHGLMMTWTCKFYGGFFPCINILTNCQTCSCYFICTRIRQTIKFQDWYYITSMVRLLPHW